MYSVNTRVAEFWGDIEWFHYYDGKFQDPSIKNGQIQKPEKQCRHNWIQQTQQSTEYIWYL